MAEPGMIERTISAEILAGYYSKHVDEYDGDYPDVLNPAALVDGIEELLRALGGGFIPENTILYIVENDDDKINPHRVRYVITVYRGIGSNGGPAYALRVFYNRTNEMEALSVFEEDQVVWASDTIYNTKHRDRTKYYLGFAYMLCDKSPGFDREPMPERELTGSELIALGVQGELPPELIDVVAPEEVEVSQAEEPAEEESYDGGIDLGGREEREEAVPIPETDDTEVVIATPEDYEEDYDDLETDYEELFE